MDKIIKPSDHPYTSLFVPFTRAWFVDDFLLNLERMELPWSSMEVVFYNDTTDSELSNKLMAWLEHNAPIVNGARVYQSNRPKLGEYSSVNDRRDRIVAVKQDSVKLLSDSELVFCLEDDTIAPRDAYPKLAHYLSGYPDVMLASGVQVGRWAYRVYGAWKIEPLHAPDKVYTVGHRGMGAQFVDGVGWYCYLTRTHEYKTANYHYEAECLGPDVCYAWDLRKRGFRVVIDWDVPCAHVMEHNAAALMPSEHHVIQKVWYKDSDGTWVVQ